MVKNTDNNFHTLRKMSYKNITSWKTDNSAELYKLLTANKPIRG